jgi:hypothetical protein
LDGVRPRVRRRWLLALAGALSIVITGCSPRHAALKTTYHQISVPSQVTVEVPGTWHKVAHPPPSVGLVLLARGPASRGGCPQPLLLVRQQGQPTGTLAQAVALYNRLEQIRRPGRVITEQRAVRLRGMRAAVLIVARFPAGEDAGSSATGPVVKSFDLLGLTKAGEAVHLFASGCPADLPGDFLKQAVLSLHAG